MRAIDADAFMDDINNSIDEMTKIGIMVDGEWLWAKLNDALDNAPVIELSPHWIHVARGSLKKTVSILYNSKTSFSWL